LGIWQCTANAGYYAKYTKTVKLVMDIPDDLADPATVEAYVRSAAGGFEDITVVVE
jgi:hypothetical protein